MKNKKFWPGMLVMVLVFGMTVVGCGGNVLSGTTWLSEDRTTVVNFFSNGDYEYYSDRGLGIGGTSSNTRDSYTISGKTIILGSGKTLTYSVKGNKLTLDGEFFNRKD